MGLPTSPQEAAPAYDEVFADHPVNRFLVSGSSSAYAAVPQHDDDVELQAHGHNHNHTSGSPAPAADRAPESFMQTLASAIRPKPHVHCGECDVQLEAKQKRDQQKHCCTMVAATFMTAFVCIMFGAIVINAVWAKSRRHSQDLGMSS